MNRRTPAVTEFAFAPQLETVARSFEELAAYGTRMFVVVHPGKNHSRGATHSPNDPAFAAVAVERGKSAFPLL